MIDDFNVSDEVQWIKQYRKMARRKIYRSSKLSEYRAELVKLRRSGATIADIVVWLRHRRRLRVSASTVCRYLQKLPELQETKHGDI